MADFDTMTRDDAAAFIAAFGKETQALYRPERRPSYSISVIYDPETQAFDPLRNEDVDIDPMITISTADLQEEAKQGDMIEFEGMIVEIEMNEGDYAGLTLLRVRVKS